MRNTRITIKHEKQLNNSEIKDIQKALKILRDTGVINTPTMHDYLNDGFVLIEFFTNSNKIEYVENDKLIVKEFDENA